MNVSATAVGSPEGPGQGSNGCVSYVIDSGLKLCCIQVVIGMLSAARHPALAGPLPAIPVSMSPPAAALYTHVPWGSGVLPQTLWLAGLQCTRLNGQLRSTVCSI